MKAKPLLLLGAAMAMAQPAHASSPAGGSVLKPFAPELRNGRVPERGDYWPSASREEALRALGRARNGERQPLRWRYAMASLAAARPEDALGALTVMAQDEPELRLVPTWRLAAGRALVEVGRWGDALSSLDMPALQGNGEACAWRLRALAGLKGVEPALAQVPCAKGALAARSATARAPFLHDAARMATRARQGAAALHWLSFAPSGDPMTQLLKAEAHISLGRGRVAAGLLRPLSKAASEPIRVRAAAGLLAIGVAGGTLTPDVALRRADQLRFAWRGDRLERDLTLLSWDLSLKARRPRPGLKAAASLLRYHPGEPRLAEILRIVSGSFVRWLRAESGVPLPLAAGLMWDHRDLIPNGPPGDALVRQLAARLRDEGLHARAADLLEHQLAFRARGQVQGPLSIEVAQLHLLAGKPERALEAIRRTNDELYPPAIATARLRLEAVAMFQSGQEEAALALLQDAGGNDDLRAELLWRQRDWARLASVPTAGEAPLDEARQVRILRQAIALAMTNDEAGLSALRRRYSRAFAGLAAGSAFRVLTASAGDVTGEEVASALAALPTAPVAGIESDLLDLAPRPVSPGR